MNTKQGLIGLVVGLVVALVLAGGSAYLVLKNRGLPIIPDYGSLATPDNNDSNPNEPIVTDETEGWITYRDKSYEFEIRYPSTWRKCPHDDNGGASGWFYCLFSEVIPGRTQASLGFSPGSHQTIEELRDYFTSQDYFTKQSYEMVSPPPVAPEEGETISGEHYLIPYQRPGFGTNRTYYFVGDRIVLRISLHVPDPNTKEGSAKLKEAERVISTFKFIN